MTEHAPLLIDVAGTALTARDRRRLAHPLVGGIILGVAQSVGARINPEWQLLAGHLVFLAFLLLRPRGLFPKQK